MPLLVSSLTMKENRRPLPSQAFSAKVFKCLALFSNYIKAQHSSFIAHFSAGDTMEPFKNKRIALLAFSSETAPSVPWLNHSDTWKTHLNSNANGGGCASAEELGASSGAGRQVVPFSWLEGCYGICYDISLINNRPVGIETEVC